MVKIPKDLAIAAAMRWSDHTEQRERQAQALRHESIVAANSVERVAGFVARGIVRPAPFRSLSGLERIIGLTRDLLDEFQAPEEAREAGRSVGRITTRPSPGYAVDPIGTGFLVSPTLLMTNNHVIRSGIEAKHRAIQFGYARSAAGRTAAGVSFALDPARFFMTDEDLDLTLVAVAPTSDTQVPLSSLPWNVLRRVIGKVLIGQDMNIIQHPNGEPRQYALDQNRLLDILERHLHYEADTEPGSSGSPVFNDAWEVVALHHLGVPRLDRDGQILDRRGNPATDQTADQDIDWVANEGVRISQIVAFLDQQRLDPQMQQLLDELLSAESGALESAPAAMRSNTPSLSPNGVLVPERSMYTFNFYGQTTVLVGEQRAAPPLQPFAAKPLVPADDSHLLVEARRKIAPDQLFQGRSGYAPQFLGIAVPLPTLGRQLLAHAAQKISNDGDPYVLDYEHFSLVMNGRRRLAFYTAVNIDGRRSKDLKRDADSWYYDPRIPADAQAGEFLYNSNPLDRGHLVRRLDPVWGETADVANEDTFHWTNCSPQHSQLNQKTWLNLEEYLLQNAKNTDQRLTVFTGPVFDEDDPIYRSTGVKIPLRFFKVAVMKATDGQLLAAAFLQSQEKLIAERVRERTVDDLDFLAQDRRVDQVAIATVEDLVGFRFDNLRDVDGLALRGAEATDSVRIEDLKSIRLERRS